MFLVSRQFPVFLARTPSSGRWTVPPCANGIPVSSTASDPAHSEATEIASPPDAYTAAHILFRPSTAP